MSSFVFKRNNAFYSAKRDNDEVTFYPYGGGPQIKLHITDFRDLTGIEIVDDIPSDLQKGWVAIDNGMPVQAFFNPFNLWNGWIQPLFDKDSCENIAQLYLSGSFYLHQKIDNGYRIIDKPMEDSYDVFFSPINFDGQEVLVCSMAENWCWHKVDNEEAAALLFIHSIVNKDNIESSLAAVQAAKSISNLACDTQKRLLESLKVVFKNNDDNIHAASSTVLELAKSIIPTFD